MKMNKIFTILVMLCLFLITVKGALGAVVINEIMADPNAVSDANGEYVELYNDNILPVNIDGWTIQDAGTDSHTINNGGILTIPAGGYIVLCNNADPLTNGGFACDYEYSGFTLANTADEVILMDGVLEIDRVEYDGGPNFPDPTGASMELKDPSLDNNNGANWIEAYRTLTAGDLGSPGETNNDAPLVSGIPDQTVPEGQSFTTFDLDGYLTEVDGDSILWSYSGNVDLSVSLDANNVATVTAPNLNWNGAETITFTATDNNAAALSGGDNAVFTVTPVNDLPTLNIPDDSLNEDAGLIQYNLHNFANDIEDPDSSLTFTLDSQSDTSAVSCTLNADGYDLDCNTVPDQSGQNTVQITVRDTEGGSATDSFTITINPVNDAPVINPVADQEAYESVEFSYTVSATDVDNPLSDLFIDSRSAQLPPWLEVNPNNLMQLIGTPTANDLGVNQAVIAVTDGDFGYSEQVTLNITVLPSLNIEEDSIQIEMGGVTYSSSDELNVSPGDEVRVSFDFRNNYDHNLGHVGTKAYTTPNLPGFEGLPHAGYCSGVSCDNGYWSLNPQEVGQDDFTFTVPYDISANDFLLTLEAYHDNHWGGLSLEDFYTLNFNVVRKDVQVVLLDSSVSDINLTCVRTTDLNLEIANVGNSDIAPEILIYDQQPIESSFDKTTGEFTSFTSPPSLFVEKTAGTISSGTTLQVQVPVDTINLSNGQHTLYIYLVNPYFNSNEYYVGDSSHLDINIGDCLDIATLEDYFTIAKGNLNGVAAKLTEFINEDSNYNLEFSVEDQTNENLVSCSMMGTSQLMCIPQNSQESGTSEVTMAIDEASTLTPVRESFTVTLMSFLEISDLQINSISMDYGGQTDPLKPGQSFDAEFIVTNNLDHPVTGINAQFLSSPVNAVSSDSINLDAGESGTISLTISLPYNTIEGDYPANILVEGRDFEDNTIIRSDAYQFILNVVQDPAAVSITDMTLGDQEISCKAYTTLNVELTNLGSNSENDVMLRLTGGSDLELTAGPFTLSSNGGQLTHEFTIPASDLSAGTNTLTADVTYRDGFKQDSQTVDVNKSNCLSSYSPEQDQVIVADGIPLDFSVGLAEAGFENAVIWYQDDQQVAVGQTTYTFLENIPGEHQVKVVVNANQEETHTWTVTVTDVPLSSNFQTNIPAGATDAELASFDNFTIENQYGRIVYNEPVDLRNIADLDSLVIIDDSLVAVDTAAAPEFNKQATITLFKTFGDPIILSSAGFNTDNFAECSSCTLIENNAADGFVFSVTGFLTYKVEEKVPAEFEISDILIEDVDRGENGSAAVTVKNIGNYDSLTDLNVDFDDVDSDYHAQIVGSIPSTLAPGEELNLTLELIVPEDEDSGQHSIGSLRVTGKRGSDSVTKTAVIYLNPKSYLLIDSIKINGKSSGDLSPEDDTNKIEVKVKNEYTEDIENVAVTVKILDVGGDDLEEKANERDINDGDDERFTVEFDLSKENLDEDSYTIEITAEGEATDGSQHEVIETKEVDVKRENHKVVIRRAVLNPDIVQCTHYANLEVKIENIGEHDEDDVEVRISNSALDLEESKENIELDRYSRDDNEYTARFYLQNYLENAPAGNYPIEIELYRGNDLEESTTVNLEVKECTSQTTTQTQTTDQLAQLQQDNQQQLQSAFTTTAQQQPTVKTSFRDTNTYLWLLGLIVFLALAAAVLVFIVLVTRKKRYY